MGAQPSTVPSEGSRSECVRALTLERCVIDLLLITPTSIGFRYASMIISKRSISQLPVNSSIHLDRNLLFTTVVSKGFRTLLAVDILRIFRPRLGSDVCLRHRLQVAGLGKRSGRDTDSSRHYDVVLISVGN